MFLLLKHRIKHFVSVIISAQVSNLLKVRDGTLQRWHLPSLLIFFHSLCIVLKRPSSLITSPTKCSLKSTQVKFLVACEQLMNEVDTSCEWDRCELLGILSVVYIGSLLAGWKDTAPRENRPSKILGINFIAILIRPWIILSLALINNLTNGQVYYLRHNPFSAMVHLSFSLCLSTNLLTAHPFLFHIKRRVLSWKLSLNKHFKTNVVVLIYTGSYTKLVICEWARREIGLNFTGTTVQVCAPTMNSSKMFVQNWGQAENGLLISSSSD